MMGGWSREGELLRGRYGDRSFSDRYGQDKSSASIHSGNFERMLVFHSMEQSRSASETPSLFGPCMLADCNPSCEESEFDGDNALEIWTSPQQVLEVLGENALEITTYPQHMLDACGVPCLANQSDEVHAPRDTGATRVPTTLANSNGNYRRATGPSAGLSHVSALQSLLIASVGTDDSGEVPDEMVQGTLATHNSIRFGNRLTTYSIEGVCGNPLR